jgi:hypothetical protein
LLNGIKSKSGLAGYMPLKSQYGFIYSGNIDTRTIAHELGHGAFRLYHTFSDRSTYIRSQGTTSNLMDYNNGIHLNKYQWDKIHDPEGGLYLFQDEEEGAAMANSSNLITEVLDSIHNGNENDISKIDFTYLGAKVYHGNSVALQNDSTYEVVIVSTLKNGKNEVKIGRKDYGIKTKSYAMARDGDFTVFELYTSYDKTLEIIVETKHSESLKLYLFGSDKYEEVYLSNVQWYSQFDTIIGCNGDGCCWHAANYILNQATGKNAPQNTANNIAILASPSNYNQLIATVNFENKLTYLENKITEGGEPVVIGVHYNRTDAPYNTNDATRHFIVIVGKGYDETKKANYFRFYEVGTNTTNEETRGKNESNRLYVDKEKRTISGKRGYDNRFYTVTEIRENK